MAIAGMWRLRSKAGKLEKNGQERGMLVDFGDLKKDLRELADSMDHTLIYEEKYITSENAGSTG